MSVMKRLFPLVVLVIVGAALMGQDKTSPQAGNMTMAEITRAVAVLEPASGSTVHGKVTFEKVSGGIHIVADVEGLTPGEHGFHIHEDGDCSSMDAMTTGGHFNPTRMPHGGPNDAQRHAGDMGNITAGKDGKAHYDWTDSMMSFSGATSIIGRAVIVHGGADDLKSQPAGNSGPRVACGVIGIAK